jgi:hypothetical protein
MWDLEILHRQPRSSSWWMKNRRPPHEIMRFVAMGDESVLQSKLGNNWEHIYRVVFLPRVDVHLRAVGTKASF